MSVSNHPLLPVPPFPFPNTQAGNRRTRVSRGPERTRSPADPEPCGPGAPGNAPAIRAEGPATPTAGPSQRNRSVPGSGWLWMGCGWTRREGPGPGPADLPGARPRARMKEGAPRPGEAPAADPRGGAARRQRQHQHQAGRGQRSQRGPGPGVRGLARVLPWRVRQWGAPAPLGLGLGSGEGEQRPPWTCFPRDRSRCSFASSQDGGPEPRLQPEAARVKGRGRGWRVGKQGSGMRCRADWRCTGACH